LAALLTDGGPTRILAFLRALAPDMAWPETLEQAIAEPEVNAKAGRIDLLISGRAASRTWGAVVELKFDHHLKGNPLAAYAKHAKTRGMVFQGTDQEPATGVLVVLGRTLARTTGSRLIRNRQWRFVHWLLFLRRFERELAVLPTDNEFSRLRRLIWERVL
jgi:hypothetical protein